MIGPSGRKQISTSHLWVKTTRNTKMRSDIQEFLGLNIIRII